MAQIYISYHTGDSGKMGSSSAVVAERIETELKRHFGGRVSIYRDKDERIDRSDFSRIDRELKDAALLIAVIGTDYTTADITMRREIETALNIGTKILVVLAGGTQDEPAQLPEPDSLPLTIHELYQMSGTAISADNFYSDLRDTVQIVERLVSRPAYSGRIVAGILGLFILILCVFVTVVGAALLTPQMSQNNTGNNRTPAEASTQAVVQSTAEMTEISATSVPVDLTLTSSAQQLDDVTSTREIEEVQATATRITISTQPPAGGDPTQSVTQSVTRPAPVTAAPTLSDTGSGESPEDFEPTSTTFFCVHDVSSGETLNSIAAIYGLTVDELLAANDLTANEVVAGATLLIPECGRIGEQPLGSLDDVTSIVTPTPLSTGTAVPTLAPTLDLGESDVNVIEAEPDPADGPSGGASSLALGDASVFVFHDLSYAEREPLNVALELYFDTVNITATPRSPITAVPVTQEATRPQVSAPNITETPPPARFVTQVPDVPPLVVASLLCPDGFSNCGDHPDRFRLRIDRPNDWAWSVIPEADAPDIAQFTVQLWRAADDGEKTNERLFSYSMTIGTAGGTNIVAPLAIASVVVLGAGVAFIAWRMGRRSSILTRTDPLQPVKPAAPVGLNRPSAFISYRRNPSWGVALKIHDTLSERGANVFMDVHDLRDGRFSEALEHEIKNREYMILLLAPTTLESEWVRREVQYALEHGRTIIPVLTDGFDFDRDLPPEFKDISSFNAITLTLEYYDAAINRIAKFLGVG